MSFFREVDPGMSFRPFILFRDRLGFVPGLFRAQTLLPRVIEAEAAIAGAVLLKEGSLTRTQKESILLVVATARRNPYCVTAHGQMLRLLGMEETRLDALIADYRDAGLPPEEIALLEFCHALALEPAAVGRESTARLRAQGLGDEAILEAILVTALTEFLCSLSVGLGVRPDFPPRQLPERPLPPPRRAPFPTAQAARVGPGTPAAPAGAGPHLAAAEIDPATFPPFVLFRERFGFIPNIFRAQTLRPDVLEAEADVVRTVLLSDDVLPRVRKEYILLAVSADNLNTYCVAVHSEMLRHLGIPETLSDRIAVDHRQAGLPQADVALLDFARRLNRRPEAFGRDDLDGLRRHGFSDEQILEAVVMIALTRFLNTLQRGVGSVPDFRPRRDFLAASANLSAPPQGPMQEGADAAGRVRTAADRPGPATASADPDAGLVARVVAGDLVAFEELVRRHQRRIYRTLVGITGRPEEAEDGMQNAFLRAYERIGTFKGGARFSTWLTRIAINEGLDRLRGRREQVSLEDLEGDDESFRPVRIGAWEEDPERLCSRAELRALVERELLKLPEIYRIAVMLRDIEQLGTEEAAAALDLPVPTLKTRLLRGRLMLREALAPHFLRTDGTSRGVTERADV